MTHPHDTEEAFREDVAEPWLRENHPNADVIKEEEWVDRTGAFADYWVDLGTHILAVEVGDDDSVRDECAQAIEYAGDDPNAVPFVIVPDGHTEDAVVEVFRERGVVIREL